MTKRTHFGEVFFCHTGHQNSEARYRNCVHPSNRGYYVLLTSKALLKWPNAAWNRAERSFKDAME